MNEPPTTRVVHVRREPFDVYIGRPMPGYRDEGWGNPFKIGRDGDRDAVLYRYVQWLKTGPSLLLRLSALHGKVLGCWCSPAPCHGDVLAALADGRLSLDDL